MARYSRLDNQAPAQTQLQADRSPVGRSAHDFSTIHNGNAIIGAITPVDCFDVVPNEDITLSLASLLEFRNPTVRQLYNGMRVYFHAYYNRLTDLWEGARNFIDKGRSGKISLKRPNLIYHIDKTIDDKQYSVNACTPMSLLNYLGMPVEVYTSDQSGNLVEPLYQFKPAITNSNFSSGDYYKKSQYNATPSFFPADCAMAYQRNYRDFYMNKNLMQMNKLWFPDNEEHFILSYSCENAVAVAYEHEDLEDLPGSQLQAPYAALSNLAGKDHLYNMKAQLSVPGSFKRTEQCNNPTSTQIDELSSNTAMYAPNLSGLRFRQFRGDRFTAASPFPDLLRGDVPNITLTKSDLANINLYEISDTGNTLVGRNLYVDQLAGSNSWVSINDSSNDHGFQTFKLNSIDTDVFAKADIGSALASLTMSDIYTLETLTAFRRRMGLTNGDYNELVKAQYGVSPNVHDRKGTYIGGFYQDFAFSSVTQQSQSTESSPLGTKAGQGISSGSGSLGHFHTPDFGWIQVYMIIVPDVYYTNGVPRMFQKDTNLKMYFPIFNNLPPQEVKRSEMNVAGSESSQNGPFAYEDRYAEYKTRTNRVSGLMGLPNSVAAYDAARIMARRFTGDTTLTFNNQFVTMIPENIDMNVFTVVDEPPFDFSIGISCRRVFPGPYTAMEGMLSSPALNNMGA